ncbi:MAG TPA: sulfite exporter TauE/SafE family protein [Burkholderiales bacterium]|jgi:sulfite exporter TauE/SafE|nr:sulfite exporter TauE/SafE family protein [Burkholderiales bacterium]
MTDLALPLGLFAAGLASGLHCAGMCGGISAGFSLLHKEEIWKRQLAFNAGRITSYTGAGAGAGALGSAAAYAAAVLPAQTFFYFFSSAFVLLAGMHFWGMPLPISTLERIGLPLWRRVQPLAARLLPARTLPQAYAAGLAWGWLPCGLVYGALAAAVFSGGAAQGAAAMAAFGAGTLPWLFIAGVAAAKLRGWAGLATLRRLTGALLIGLGGFGVAHASGLGETLRQTLACF